MGGVSEPLDTPMSVLGATLAVEPPESLCLKELRVHDYTTGRCALIKGHGGIHSWQPTKQIQKRIGADTAKALERFVDEFLYGMGEDVPELRDEAHALRRKIEKWVNQIGD